MTETNDQPSRQFETTIDIVTTNKTPTGAVRGFGAPQLIFAIERLMHRIAVELDEGGAHGELTCCVE